MNDIYPSAQVGSSVGPDRDTVNAESLCCRVALFDTPSSPLGKALPPAEPGEGPGLWPGAACSGLSARASSESPSPSLSLSATQVEPSSSTNTPDG